MEGPKIVLSIGILQKCMKYLTDDHQKALLLTGIADFTQGIRTESTGDSLVDFALDMVLADIGEQDKKYSEKREKNRENVRKRWEKTDTTECDRIRPNTTVYDGIPNDTTVCDRIPENTTVSSGNTTSYDQNPSYDLVSNININIKEKEKENKKEKQEKEKTPHPADGSAGALHQIIDTKTDHPALRDSLREFCRMRTRIKKPLTNRALTLAIDKLFSMAADPDTLVKIVNQSVEHCWQTFYELKDNAQTQYKPTLDRTYSQRTNDLPGADDFPEWLKDRIPEQGSQAIDF